MEDRRSVKTKKVIRKVFLELLAEKNINRISVVEISKRADLGRGTFYLHYKDVYDLMETLENELIDNLGQLYNASCLGDNSMNILKFTDTLTEYMDANRDLFLVVARTENGGRTMEKVKYFFNQKLLSDSPITFTELDVAEVLFSISGVFGVLEAWLKDGMITPHKSVSEMLHHVLIKLE
jgi:AcrR family transcriptional regulator